MSKRSGKRVNFSLLHNFDKDLIDSIINKYWVIVPWFVYVLSCLCNIFILRLKTKLLERNKETNI